MINNDRTEDEIRLARGGWGRVTRDSQPTFAPVSCTHFVG